MSKIKIFDTDHVTVWYHPEKKIVHHEMHKYTHGQAFRDVLMVGLEAMKKYQAQKWLSDDRKNPVLNSEDSEWSKTYWRPQVLEAGWKYWAIVQPEKPAAKFSMDKIAKDMADFGVTVQIFNDPEEAIRWLENKSGTD